MCDNQIQNTVNESILIDEIFGVNHLWRDKYKLRWCDLCETVSALCPECKNGSCNGGGCESCMKDYPDWKKTKHSINNYLSLEERKTFRKIFYLKKYIIECLAAGYDEINWDWLHTSGNLCYGVYFLFDELSHLREQAIADYKERSNNSDPKTGEELLKTFV